MDLDRAGRLHDRGPELGLRQLGHPVQGVRHARACRATRSRRSRTRPQVHAVTGPGPAGVAAHPVGPGRRLRRARGPRQGARGAHRRDQLQPVPGRRLQARLADPRRRADPGQGGRRTTWSASTIMRETGSTDLKIWLPDGTNYAGQDSLRGRQDRLADSLRAGLRRAGRRPAAAAGVQVLRAVLLRDGHPGLGHLAAALPRAGRAGAGRAGHRPPRAGHQHRVHRHAAAAAEPVGRVRLQLPLLRRRRPDRRLGGPVPAVPDPGRDRRPSARTARSRA